MKSKIIKKTKYGVGHIPWNKGLKIQTNTGKTHFKKGVLREKCASWKGGEYVKKGYYWIYCPDHPNSDRKEYGYVKRSKLVVEKTLGRYLNKGETIHHIDENKLNDQLKNLYLFTLSVYHTRYHHLLRHGKIKPILTSNII